MQNITSTGTTGNYNVNSLVLFFIIFITVMLQMFMLQSKLSAEQKARAISDIPSLMEMLGFSLYYGGFMIGPQVNKKLKYCVIQNMIYAPCIALNLSPFSKSPYVVP